MLGQQFYHETTRKVVVAFGTMFNNIQLVRKDNDGTITQSMKVPLAYGPRQKFLVRLREDPDLTKQVAITLPRIGFEITGLSYDPTRKLNRVQKFKKTKSGSSSKLDTQYMPVPYNLGFELSYNSKFQIRLGRNNNGFISTGIGLIWSRFSIDYAYRPSPSYTGFGSSQLISFRLDPSWLKSKIISLL